METYRLKNIVIFILIVVNIFLVFLVASRYYMEYRAQQQLIEQTSTLLARNGIAIDSDLLKSNQKTADYTYIRSETEEKNFVSKFLGEAESSKDSAGAIFYTSPVGNASFRSNGSFSLKPDTPIPFEGSPDDFVYAHCPSHYRITQSITHGNSAAVTAIPFVNDLPVFGAAMQFHFGAHALTSVSGFFLPYESSSTGSLETITKSSASISLMDYCRKEGRICNEISDISSSYLLQSTVSAPLLLTPVYLFSTNTYQYYVNAITGHVSVSK